MKDGKSTGEDGITTEVLKRCHLDEIVLDFCNQALLEGKRPDQWVLMNIVPIPKVGDLSLGENHRGITLMSIVAKLLNKMLLNRIRSPVDKELRKNQNGFRIGRSTVGQVLAIRRLIEGVKRKNLSAILTFVDFKKAFDTIHRGMMFDILRAYGIPERIVKAIECMYRGTKAKVLSPDGETELFEIKSGVLQGDTLAPLLFIIVLDYALRKATIGREEELGFQLSKRQSRRVRPVVVTDLDFADDIALLSEEIQQAQLLLTSVETCCAEVGLKINAKKTEYITLNVEDAPNLTTISGRKLKCVDDFKYLGAWIRDTQKDIKVRKAIAWSVAHKLKKVWLSRMTRKLKVRLFETTVIPVLTYGSETWTTTVSDIKGLDGCFTRLLRFALNVHWSERMTNEDLYGEIPRLSNRLKRKRLQFAGHMVRAQGEIGSLFVLWEPKRGIANRGRPMKNYIDVIRDDTGLKTTDEIRNVMENREIWKTYL